MGYLLGVFDLLFAILIFIIFVISYSMGIKHGIKMSKGEAPNVNLNPITIMKDYKLTQAKEAEIEHMKKEADLVQEGFFGEDGIMNYDPYKQKEGE